MSRLAPVLTETDLPLAELHAARLDGELYAIGDGFAPIDEQEQARHRAQSLARIIQPRLIAERMTAAWIHGVLMTPPAVHDFCVSLSARARVTASRRFALREVVVGDDEVQRLGGVLVTTPLRTALDIARSDSGFDATAKGALLGLLAGSQMNLTAFRRDIESRYKLAGKRLALSRVTELEQEIDAQVVTRYTS